MKKIHTAKELYNEILKSMYLGVYQSNDKLMTYQEIHETYGLAKDTISSAYKMLRQDGVVTANRANGTIVTFDINNPDHVAKVPLQWPEHDDLNEKYYHILFKLHGKVLYAGITNLNDQQRQLCKQLLKSILEDVKQDSLDYEDVFSLWQCLISAIDNTFFKTVADHFVSKHMYFIPSSRLNICQFKTARKLTKEFYNYLQTALEQESYEEFSDRVTQYYEAYYQQNGILFSKIEENAIFREQALYRKLLQELCLEIFAKNLQKGDALPTTAKLCRKYNISKTTVTRAYGILTQMGLINRNGRNGTKLIAEPNDVNVVSNVEKFVGLEMEEWKDIVDALSLLNETLADYIEVTPEIVEQMRETLESQRKLFEKYTIPFFVSDVLISPWVQSLPVGIFHKYYVELTDILNRIMTLIICSLHANKESGKVIYRLIEEALDALESGDKELFLQKGEEAMRKNVDFIVRDFKRSSGDK